MRMTIKTGGQAVRRLGERTLLGVLLLAAYPPDRLTAQCPDGSPPPCNRPPTIQVDSNALAILPFRTTGPSNDVQWLGEGMVDLQSVSLDGFAGWRTVHPRTVLARATSLSEMTDVAGAARVARSAGAATMVLGSAVALGPQLRLHADLYDARTIRRLTSVDAVGTVALPGPVVDSLAVGLARARLKQSTIAGRRPPTEYATTSPQALRAYLAAEQLGRRGQLQLAADSLLRAIALDSTFGLAYYRLWIVTTFGATAPGWGQRSIILGGLHYDTRLTPRERDLLLALDAQQRGLVDDALGRADDLGRHYPDDAEAAYVQGEAYYHLGLFAGEPRARAEAAFERGIRLDPGLLENYNHPIELLAAEQDTVAALAFLAQLRERSPTYLVGHALEIALRVGLHHTQVESLMRQIGDLDTAAVLIRAELEALRSFDGRPGLAVATADTLAASLAAFPAGRTARSAALAQRVALAMAQGRYHFSDSILADLRALDPDGPATAQTIIVASLYGRTPPADGRRVSLRVAKVGFNEALLAAWRAAIDGDSGAAHALLHDRLPNLPDNAEALYGGLEGLAALNRGDTAAARQLLRVGLSLTPAALLGFPGGAPLSPQGAFALQLARIERRDGDLSSSLHRLHFTAFANNGLVLERAEAEELRGQIAEQRGDTAAAIAAYRNFVELWKNADPELRPRVEAARTALARLVR